MFENIFFLLCRKNHTLATTWGQGTAAGDKTITGCVVGQPVFIIHHVTKNLGGDSGQYVNLRVISGAKHATTTGCHYILGTDSGSPTYPRGTTVFIIIPTATSVVVNLYGKLDDEELLVYKT